MLYEVITGENLGSLQHLVLGADGDGALLIVAHNSVQLTDGVYIGDLVKRHAAAG